MNFSPNYSFANSTLDIKASGNVDISQDLNMPEGKSIAELLYDKKENESTEQR
jgi:hypothetical protein